MEILRQQQTKNTQLSHQIFSKRTNTWATWNWGRCLGVVLSYISQQEQNNKATRNIEQKY
jgi:hypothetical protein